MTRRLPIVNLTNVVASPGGQSQRGSHRLGTTIECPRRWFFSVYRKLKSNIRPDYFVRGGLIHLLLAFHYAGRVPTRPAWRDQLSLDELLAREATGYPALIQTAREVFTSYIARGMDQNGMPWAVEHEIGGSIGDIARALGVTSTSPWDSELVTSRIDLIVIIGGKVWFKDYKSTLKGWSLSLPRWSPMNEFMVKFQFMIQEALGRLVFGDKFGGILVQRLKAKTPFDMDEQLIVTPRQYVMHDLVPLLRRCVEEEARLCAEGDALSDEAVEMHMPMGHPWSCFSYGKPCEYLPICTAESPGHRVMIEAHNYTKHA